MKLIEHIFGFNWNDGPYYANLCELIWYDISFQNIHSQWKKNKNTFLWENAEIEVILIKSIIKLYGNDK